MRLSVLNRARSIVDSVELKFCPSDEKIKKANWICFYKSVRDGDISLRLDGQGIVVPDSRMTDR